MTRAYSVDLRHRVNAAVLQGGSIRSVAAQFDVSPGFVSKLRNRVRRTGSLRPDAQGGDRRSAKIERHADWLLGRVAETPDITLKELCAELEGRGMKAASSTLWRFLDRHELTFKKRQPMQANRNGRT